MTADSETLAAASDVQADEEGCRFEEAPRQRLTPLWALKSVYCIGTGSSACLWKYITVFYHHIGLTNSQIGLIQMMNPAISFVSQIIWAAICDHLGSYKEVLVISNVLGVATVFCCLFGYVQAHFAVLCVVILASSAFMSSRGSVNDSMALQIVDDYKKARDEAVACGEASGIRSLPTYGEQRLWGAAGWGFCSLFGGYLMDAFGIPFMFISFGCLLSLTILVIAFYFPARQASRNRSSTGEAVQFRWSQLLKFELLWFFANLLVYGACMSLVETFLFVYLLRDFEGTSSLLLGSTIFFMCLFEVPMFLYVDKAFTKFDLTTLLSMCHVVFGLRCVLYAILPSGCPWTVLLVEPLHGVTFACMWSCSVEYSKRLAPPGAQAKVQALVNGLYYQLAIGCGSFVWGPLTEEPPRGFGFRPCFIAAAVLLLCWSVIWNVGWCMRRRRLPDTPLLSSARELQ